MIKRRASAFVIKIAVLSATACLLLLAAIFTCQIQSRHYAHDPYWNDVARYLAGMEVREKSVLWPLTQEPVYKMHRQFMDDLWGRIQKETIDLIIPWREQNIPSFRKRAAAFYPLSGADFINLHTLFPDANRYLMIALEPGGDVSLLRDHKSRRLIDGLTLIQRSIYLYGLNNYFQTRVMAQEMINTILPGTAPSLLIFMARLGLVIKNVENVHINSDGNLVHITIDHGKPLPHTSGVRISFIGTDGSSRELVYLSMKIGPESVDRATPEGKYLDRLRDIKTMMKSAVYLLHHSPFEPVRDFILQRSILMVQDDSGIPYRYFTEGWNITLYGIYRPAMQLKQCLPDWQADLNERYMQGAAELPFNFGYGILFGQRQSNLMVAKKK